MFARNTRILAGEAGRGQTVHPRDHHRKTSRLSVVVAAMTIPVTFIGAVDTVRAEGECGAPAAGTGVVNCTSAGNPYSAGINYNVYGPGPAEPFTPPFRSGVNVNDGVNLTVNGATIVRDPLAPTGVSGAGISVQSWVGGGAPIVGLVSVTVTGGSIITTGSTTTVGLNSQGIAVGTRGAITIKVDGATIETWGDGAHGVFATSGTTGPVFVDTKSSTITVHGSGSSGISAENTGGGQLTVQSGKIDTTGTSSFGVFAGGSGVTIVNTTAAPISTTGDDSAGVVVYKGGPGALTVTTGPIATVGNTAYGVVANVFGADRTDVNTTAAPISTKGTDASGIVASMFSANAGALTITSGQIDTLGARAHGIDVWNIGSGATTINTTAAPITTQGDDANGVNVNHGSDAALKVQSGQISTAGTYAYGITTTNGGSGSTLIDATAGPIATTGYGAVAIDATQYSDGPLTVQTGRIDTQGVAASGINATNYGISLTSIDTRGGLISTRGDAALGVSVQAMGAGAPVEVRTGSISTGDVAAGTGAFAAGVTVFNQAGGSTLIDTTAGTIQTVGNMAAGVAATAEASGPIDIRTAGVSTLGQASAAVGAFGGGVVGIDTTAGSLTTAGSGSAGVFAFSYQSTFDAKITTGPITTTGAGAYGVAAVGTGPGQSGPIAVTNAGPILSSGFEGGGIVAVSYSYDPLTGLPAASGPVTVNANANITATGQNAPGISASSDAGPVNVSVASGVSVQGGWSMNATDLSTSASVAYSSAGGPFFMGSNLPAAGIVVFSGATSVSPAMTITNNGFVGALNDRAITMGAPCAWASGSGGNNRQPPPGGGGGNNGSGNEGGGNNGAFLNGMLGRFAAAVSEAIVPSAHAVPAPTSIDCADGGGRILPPVQSLTVDNNNTITGYVTFWGGAPHIVNNAGMFDVRHFADTNGDGVRDTKRVSVSDFGGPNATFNNLGSGTVKLAPVSGAPATDPTGYYVPTTGSDSRALETSVYDLNREGVVQGQFVNLQTFDNAGIIDLRGPTVGNTLVMTSNPTAGGAPGIGVFVANGGQLRVNSVLNAGIPLGGSTGSQSDVLIVDSTRLGGAPTTISVTNVGGAGAYTPGNGIEVVEVRNKAGSAPGVFTLQGQYVTPQGQQAVVAGAYAYTLFRNGVGGDSADGNWYLRSQLTPVTPPPVGPGGEPPPPEQPRYNPGAPIYETYPQMLLSFQQMGTMEQRIGERYSPERTPREIFCKDASRNFRCTVSNEQAGYYADQSGYNKTVWGRIEGGHSQFRPAFSTSSATSSHDTWRAEAGIDGLLYQNSREDQLFGSVFAHYGQIFAKVDSPHGNGRIDTNGYGVGASLTWKAQNGFYVDAVARTTWYGSALRSDTANNVLTSGNNGFGYAVSLESGKKIALNRVWSLTPQAQLTYSTVNFDSFIDPFGARVSLDRAESLQGRLGLSTDRTTAWRDDLGRTSHSKVYGIANLYYEFLDGTQVDVSGTKFINRNDRLWGGLGVGTTYSWANDKYALFGEGSVRTSLTHFADSYALTGTVGFKARW